MLNKKIQACALIIYHGKDVDVFHGRISFNITPIMSKWYLSPGSIHHIFTTSVPCEVQMYIRVDFLRNLARIVFNFSIKYYNMSHNVYLTYNNALASWSRIKLLLVVSLFSGVSFSLNHGYLGILYTIFMVACVQYIHNVLAP
jgi:hypothetical protein